MLRLVLGGPSVWRTTPTTTPTPTATFTLTHTRHSNPGAYSVSYPEGVGPAEEDAPDSRSVVTFIDTPGHSAFNEMRSRGANITDIVILAVAADDGIKQQTIESIRAAKAADVPIILALTKVDKPDADPSKVRTQLLEHEVILEEFGGEVLSAQVSAKTGDGLTDLMEQVRSFPRSPPPTPVCAYI